MPPVQERGLPGAPAPEKAAPAPDGAAPADNGSGQAAGRCTDLSGAAREQCLREQQGAAAGASSAPEPRTAPPPQNPR